MDLLFPSKRKAYAGVTLIETIVFVVIVSIALATLLQVFSQGVGSSVDPVARARAIAIAQAQLDEILARKFDENTPTGGIPACGTMTGPVCLGVAPESDFDDVGDYEGFGVSPSTFDTVNVSVVPAGDDLGLPLGQARLITVTVTNSVVGTVRLSSYRVNF